jgi:hypothetical protein
MTNTQQQLQQGIQLHQAGNLAAAEQIYKQILMAEPENLPALNLLSTIACQVGNLEVANQLVQFALELNPLFAESYNSLGNIYKVSGNLAAALVQYQIAVQLEPQHFIAQNNAKQIQQANPNLDLSPFAQTPEPIAIAPDATTKPTVAIIHQLARSGGTILSKCIACMQDVVLLSEIHPTGSKLSNQVFGRGGGYMHHSLWQSHFWHQLFEPQELLWVVEQAGKADANDFAEHIALIQARCAAAQKHLVIRDWCHIDFLGVPFTSELSLQMTTTNALATFFELKRLFTLRHPLDQWLSTNKGFTESFGVDVDIERYLQGYLPFAIAAAEHGFVRYEDFVAQPAETLITMCDYLGIDYDADWVNQWWKYTKITGDPRANTGEQKIAQRPKSRVDAAILDQFAAVPEYGKILDLLGYEHPD